jgi:hypothetical protein
MTANNTLENNSNAIPKDLIITGQPDSVDKDKFIFTIPDLKLDETYAFQFQYVFKDGGLSQWSPSYVLLTPTETVPAAPSASVPSTGTGNIPVTLNTYPANAKRVDIVVIGGIYGTGKTVDYFLEAGTKTISITEAGEYQVALYTVTPTGILGTPTSTFTITVSSTGVDTTTPPGAPSAVIVSAANESSDPSNRTGYIDVSWTAGTNAVGYWVGVWDVNPSTNPSAVPVQEKTTTTSAKIEGLFVGKQYWVRVRSFGSFNVLSEWIAPALNYPITIPGTALVPGKVTVSGTSAPKSIVLSWTVPDANADLVINGGYYIVKLYTNSGATGTPLSTRTAFSNTASFSGLTTGTSYWATVQGYTSGGTAVAGQVSDIFGPLVPTAVDNPDIAADFILANNQFQVGSTSGANDVHLSAYTKTVGGQEVKGRIYIGGPETSVSAAVGLYNDSGTPFYADNLGRLSLGDKLTWSGGALKVIGTVDITGASTFNNYVVAGATPTTLNTSNYVGIGFDVPYKDNSTTTNSTLTGLVINKYSASASTSDWIKTDGSFRLGLGKLTFDGATLSINASGTFTGSLSIGSNDSIFKADPTIGIWLGDADYADADFRVSTTGILRARSGNIGGWQIDSTQLRSVGITTGVNYISLDTTTPRISLVKQVSDVNSGTGTITIDPVQGIRGPDQTFTITRAGVAYTVTGPGFKMTPAGNADFLGTIHAASGYIGAWQITGNSIIGGSSGPFTVGLKVASVAPASEITLWADAAKTTGFPNGVGDITIWAGSSEPLFGQGANNVYTNALNATTGTDSPFYVTNTGFLKASKGRIGGWILGYTQLWGGDPDTPSSVVGLQAKREAAEFYSIWAGGNGLGTNGGPSSASPFSVTNTGKLRATAAYIRGDISGTNIYIGSGLQDTNPAGANYYTTASNYIKSDGVFKLGGGALEGTSNSLTVNTNNIFMPNPEQLDNFDLTFGDPTIVQAVQDSTGKAKLVRGRAIFYGGAQPPSIAFGGAYNISTRWDYVNYYNSGQGAGRITSTNTVPFVKGDLWLERE